MILFKIAINQSAPVLNRGLSSNLWWVRNCKLCENSRRMCEVYREVCFTKRNDIDRLNYLKMIDILFKMKTGRPLKASTLEMLDSVNALILSGWRVTIDNISEHLGISVVTAHKIVHDDFAFLRSVVVGFHQDNARSYTAWKTMETISQFGWMQLPHPPYNSDLAPSDFHLFGSLKEFRHGTKYSSDDEVKHIISKWLKT